MARLNNAQDLISLPPRTRQRRVLERRAARPSPQPSKEVSVPARRQGRKQQSKQQSKQGDAPQDGQKSREQSEDQKEKQDSPQNGEESRQQSEDLPEHQSEQGQDEASDQESERQPEQNGQAGTDEEEEEEESDVVPLNPSSSPTPYGLTIETGSKVEWAAAFNHTDLDQFLATSDLEQALDLGQKIIIGRSQVAEAVHSQCAWDISVVWKGIDRFRTTHPHALPVIESWRQDVAAQLGDHSQGIDHYLRLAEKTLMKISQSSQHIIVKWGILPTQILPKDKYSETRPLSMNSLKAMAELADLASREESRKMLTDIIERRSHPETRALYQRHDPHLCFNDIKSAIAAKRQRKRRHEDSEIGVDSVEAGLRPAKRAKGRSRSPDIADIADNSSMPSTPQKDEPETPEEMSIEVARKAPAAVPDLESPELPIFHLSPDAFTPSAPLDGSKNRQQLCSPLSPPFQAAEDPVLLEIDDSVDLDYGHSATGQESTLATLNPKSKLSSTAIDESLKACARQYCHIIHPLYFDPAFGNRKGRLKALSGDVDRIFMPMYDSQRRHWTLAVIGVKEPSIDVYDSLGPPRLDGPLVSRLEGFAQGRAPQLKDWTTRLASCPKQSNGYDCGVHVIANAFFLMANIALPETHDCDAWRLVCRAILNSCPENVKLDDLPQFHDADSEHALLRPTRDDDPLAIRTTFQLVQKQQSNLQTQRDRFQTLLTSATAIMKVMEDIRRERVLESFSVAEQLNKDQEHHSKHAAFIDEYSKLPDEYRNQDALSAMRLTQTANEKKRDGLLLQKQSAHANMLKSTDLIRVAEQIVRRYEDQLSKVDSAKERYRGTARERYDKMRDALRELEETIEL